MKKMTAIFATFAVLAFPFGAIANVIVIDPPGLQGSGVSSTQGFDFTVGSASIVVDALGLWDAGDNGLTNSHAVGLWSSSGTLLASVTIPAGSSAILIDEFRYVSLPTSITLLAGQLYVLGARYDAFDADAVRSSQGGVQATFDGAVTGGNMRATSGQSQGFAFPPVAGAGSIVGPNAQFTTVPEPTSVALLLFGTAFCLRRRTLRTHERSA